MIGAFHASADGYRAVVDSDHARLIGQVVREVLVILDEPGEIGSFMRAATEMESSRAEPDGAALENLLPPMSLDGPEAAELRALSEDVLRSEKSTRLRRLAVELRAAPPGVSEVVVRRDGAWDWLAALNDVRLALAGELGIQGDEDSDRVGDLASSGSADPRIRAASAMYVTMTWWQDSLLRAMRGNAREH